MRKSTELVPISLVVRVTPRAGSDVVVGWREDERRELAVRVAAAPHDGKANVAVIGVLARSLGIPKSAITVVRGHSSRLKTLTFDMDGQRFAAWKDSLPVGKSLS